MPLYLADSSIWSWAWRRDDVNEKLARRVAQGQVVSCVPVVLEVMHVTRDGGEYEQTLAKYFGPLLWLRFGEDVAARAFDVQRTLAQTAAGAHRIPAVDFLIAATAELAEEEVVMWHLDDHLSRICASTGQPEEREQPV